ncbi:hypothetical protein LTR37_017248 [Vermiconidia calcicola]|uniref:Uncharacterized protein n=1 Tax=Vermiconidia calcicola TaxID=1690605 RepID=A0ACC3MLS3_9PEZI|nr:hypothetical protein LTR37_017248 [Vermiconidia calcicola]
MGNDKDRDREKRKHHHKRRSADRRNRRSPDKDREERWEREERREREKKRREMDELWDRAERREREDLRQREERREEDREERPSTKRTTITQHHYGDPKNASEDPPVIEIPVRVKQPATDQQKSKDAERSSRPSGSGKTSRKEPEGTDRPAQEDYRNQQYDDAKPKSGPPPRAEYQTVERESSYAQARTQHQSGAPPRAEYQTVEREPSYAQTRTQRQGVSTQSYTQAQAAPSPDGVRSAKTGPTAAAQTEPDHSYDDASDIASENWIDDANLRASWVVSQASAWLKSDRSSFLVVEDTAKRSFITTASARMLEKIEKRDSRKTLVLSCFCRKFEGEVGMLESLLKQLQHNGSSKLTIHRKDWRSMDFSKRTKLLVGCIREQLKSRSVIVVIDSIDFVHGCGYQDEGIQDEDIMTGAQLLLHRLAKIVPDAQEKAFKLWITATEFFPDVPGVEDYTKKLVVPEQVYSSILKSMKLVRHRQTTPWLVTVLRVAAVGRV